LSDPVVEVEAAPRLDTVLGCVEAIIFDCDGVLVDSAANVDRSWGRWAERFGLDGATVLAESNGRTSPDTVATRLPADLVVEGCDLIEAIEIADADTVRMIPGALELLTSLPADRWAVVTSASPALFDARRLAAGLPRPRVVITADDVVRGKPHPEGYASALSQLGVVGGRAAGCPVRGRICAELRGSERSARAILHLINTGEPLGSATSASLAGLPAANPAGA
jgi:mannitol-1-/sugar-/sorbitol-6-phosphatase